VQTFDIRFARSAGLAAMLKVPENAFRWKGGGLLRIDAQGISIGVKRGLLALLGGKRTQRIPTENLRAVYREGDALRVEYQSGESARVVLPFWADNRDIAAQIVRLLPTSETVEIEHDTQAARPRADWRMLLSLGAALAVILVGTWAANQSTQSPLPAASVPMGDRVASELPTPAAEPIANTPQIEASAAARKGAPIAAPATSHDPPSALSTLPAFIEPIRIPMPSMDTPEAAAIPVAQPLAATADVEDSPRYRVASAWSDGIIPIELGEPPHSAAVIQLVHFKVRSNILRRYFLSVRHALTAEHLKELEDRWKMVTIRIYNEPAFEDPALMPLLEIELAVSRAWRRAFSMYADPALLGSADAEVDFADMLTERANEIVD